MKLAVTAFAWILAFTVPSLSAGQETAKATFAGGCFWCMEEAFEEVAGVLSVTSGFTGGQKTDPTYRETSSGKTGHWESVEIVYDPRRVSYEKLLDHFWRNIDPTDAGGQFCDRGSQYRSAIFYHNEQQKLAAERSRTTVAGILKHEVVTPILPASRFYPAEAYHQDYYKKNPFPYKQYRIRCGRTRRLRELWGFEAHAEADR